MAASEEHNVTENGVEEMTGPLPEMMFAEGEEPVGVRVLTYQSSTAINTILAALDDDEIQTLRQTPFGKLVDIADKPGFSGRFARYLLSRQLKVEKKHEAWFRFAGKPIRFSLREFAIVTGLPCGPFPKKSKLKRKENMTEKPYWPELFGRVDEMRVSTALKMLRRKTVTDKDIRMKVACLAIVSSVLLSTNLRMKMLKEYAEMLVDMDAFFSFPWGRLAFDMLMTSIKKRDEISLLGNTIALKGFAWAIQLVIVEAVPALTEVVQEVISSSESDSDDDEVDGMSTKTKKQTLSPSHARELDRKAEAMVTSIIRNDPLRPVEESVVIWTDEVVDVRVDNLVRLISMTDQFPKDKIRGGVRKADVSKMVADGKEVGKRKRVTKKQIAVPTVGLDEEKLKSVVNEIIRPEIQRVEVNVSEVVGTVKEFSAKAVAYQASVMANVEGLLKSFKTDILSHLEKCSFIPPGESQHHGRVTEEDETRDAIPEKTPAMRDGYAEDVDDVLRNISQYSTPEAPGKRCQGSEAQSHARLSEIPIDGHTNPTNPQNETRSGPFTKPTAVRRLSANFSQGSASNAHQNPADVCSVGVIDGETGQQHSLTGQSETSRPRDAHAFTDCIDLPNPSFSLGLTQEFLMVHPQEEDNIGETHNASVIEEKQNAMVETEENLISRQSKRMRHVPPQLISDYHCGKSILNRAQEVQLARLTCYAPAEIREKYLRLKILVKKHCVINFAGLAVTGKDLVDIGERNRVLPGRVVDILTKLVASNFSNHEVSRGETKYVFLDSKVQVLFSRNFPKYKKSKQKDAYVFTNAMVDCIRKTSETSDGVTRFYIPFNVYHKHWIGLCVDLRSCKIFVLDCNTGVVTHEALVKELLPISEMFPYLLKHIGSGVELPALTFQVERLQCVPQNPHHADSAVTACLLMQTHALFGIDSCTSVTPYAIPVEAQKAAVMVYEFQKKL